MVHPIQLRVCLNTWVYLCNGNMQLKYYSASTNKYKRKKIYSDITSSKENNDTVLVKYDVYISTRPE